MTKPLGKDYRSGWHDCAVMFAFQLELGKTEDMTAEEYKKHVLSELEKFGRGAPQYSR